MKEIDQLIHARVMQAKLYADKLAPCNKITLQKELPNRTAVYQTYHILLHGTIKRDKLITELKNEGIECSIGANALNSLPFYKRKYGLIDTDFPIAMQSYNQGLALPIGNHLSVEDIRTICEVLVNKINAH